MARTIDLLLAAVLAASSFPVLAAPSPSTPAAAAEADRLIEEGLGLRQKGKPEEAFEVFARAYSLFPSARALAQIGLVELSLRNYVDAELHISGALERHDSDWINAPSTRAALERYLGEVRANLAKLVIHATPGAKIYAEDRLLGRAPLPPMYRTPGPLRLRAQLDGFFPKEVTVLLVQTRDTEAELSLNPSSQPAPVPQVTVPQMPAADPHSGRLLAGCAALLAGAGSITVGAVWIALDGKGTCSMAPGGVCQHLYDTKLQGWVALGAGVLLAGTGAALLHWRSDDHSASVSLLPTGIVGTW